MYQDVRVPLRVCQSYNNNNNDVGTKEFEETPSAGMNGPISVNNMVY